MNGTIQRFGILPNKLKRIISHGIGVPPTMAMKRKSKVYTKKQPMLAHHIRSEVSMVISSLSLVKEELIAPYGTLTKV
jgi:ferredoxin-NADP reductase